MGRLTKKLGHSSTFILKDDLKCIPGVLEGPRDGKGMVGMQDVAETVGASKYITTQFLIVALGHMNNSGQYALSNSDMRMSRATMSPPFFSSLVTWENKCSRWCRAKMRKLSKQHTLKLAQAKIHLIMLTYRNFRVHLPLKHDFSCSG